VDISKDKIINYILFTWKQLFKATFIFLLSNFIITTTIFISKKLNNVSFFSQNSLTIFYFVISILSLIFILTVMIFHSYSYLMLLSIYPFKSEVEKAKRRFVFVVIIYFSVFLNIFLFFNNLDIKDPIFYIELLYDYIMKISLLLFILLYIAINNSVKLSSLANLEKRLFNIFIFIFILEITSIFTIYLSYLGLKNNSYLFLFYVILFSPLLILSLIKLSKEYIQEIKNLNS